MLEKIAELVREKRLEGISALRDESDKQMVTRLLPCGTPKFA